MGAENSATNSVKFARTDTFVVSDTDDRQTHFSNDVAVFPNGNILYAYTRMYVMDVAQGGPPFKGFILSLCLIYLFILFQCFFSKKKNKKINKNKDKT